MEDWCGKLIVAAMIATGGTIVAALGMLVEWGLVEEQIKVVSVLGSRQGVQHVQQEYPGVDVSTVRWRCAEERDGGGERTKLMVQIWIGAIDEELTDKGYISPGLGDAVSRFQRFEGVVLADMYRAIVFSTPRPSR